MQKHVNLVDLVKSFPTNIYLQNLASIQKRTSPVKFAHLAEKSGKGSISNLSTKVAGGAGLAGGLASRCQGVDRGPRVPQGQCARWSAVCGRVLRTENADLRCGGYY